MLSMVKMTDCEAMVRERSVGKSPIGPAYEIRPKMPESNPAGKKKVLANGYTSGMYRNVFIR